MLSEEALVTACLVGNVQTLAAVLTPATVNSPDSALGWTPLYRAVVAKHTEAAKYLLTHQADPNLPGENGETPLHQAAAEGLYDIAALLLKHKALPNLRDDTGRTPLHRAVQVGDEHMTELLLKHRAEANAGVASTHQTPLHMAVEGMHEGCVRLLLHYGASPYEPDSNQQTAFDVAPTAYFRALIEECRSESFSDTSLEVTTVELPDPTKKVGHAELQQGKLYYWLERLGLHEHFDCLFNAGFASLDDLLAKTRSPVPLTSQELEYVGVKKAGHRNRPRRSSSLR